VISDSLSPLFNPNNPHIGIYGSSFFGGVILQLTTEGDALRHYTRNYFIALGADLISLILLITLDIIERRKRNNVFVISAETPTKTIEQSEVASFESSNSQSLTRMIFDLDNVRQTLVFLIRRRPGRVRAAMYLLFVLSFTEAFTNTGKDSMTTQFAQKVYEWSATTYTSFKAIYEVVSMLGLAVGALIFVKWLKFQDSSLIIIAFLSGFMHDLLLGSILKPVVYYVALPVGCLNGFAGVAIRTRQSKLVPKEEVGKLFSVSSVIEGLVPLLSSLIFTTIFSATISTHPGAAFHFSALVLLLSLALITGEACCCRVKKEGNKENLEENSTAHIEELSKDQSVEVVTNSPKVV